MKFKPLFILLLLSFVFYGCPNSTEPEPDPCEGKYPVSADFEIWEKNVSFPYLFQSDTVCMSPNAAVFKSPNNYKFYEWTVGTQEKKYYTKEFAMRFYDHSPSFVEGPIPVQLIVKNSIDSLCFPSDDGTDTLVKNVYIIKMDDAKILGNYYGYDTTNPGVYYTINIGLYQYPLISRKHFYINNLHNGCIDTMFFGNYDIGPSVDLLIYNLGAAFDGTTWVGNGCMKPVGVAYLVDGQDSLIIDYSIQKSYTDPRFKMKFIGKRIK
jgi:hypothetical protein